MISNTSKQNSLLKQFLSKTDLPKHLTTKETLEFALKYTNITFTAEETDYFF